MSSDRDATPHSHRYTVLEAQISRICSVRVDLFLNGLKHQGQSSRAGLAAVVCSWSSVEIVRGAWPLQSCRGSDERGADTVDGCIDSLKGCLTSVDLETAGECLEVSACLQC